MRRSMDWTTAAV